MEVTNAICDDDNVKVCGMMPLLISGHFESKGRLYQMVEDVYHNFTSIHKAAVAVALLDVRKLPEEEKLEEIGLLITFCRCSLRRIFEKDGITINVSLAKLLAEIEFHLLDLVTDCTNHNVSKECMMERIGKAYFEPSQISCFQLIVNYDMMIEFIDQCLHDLDYHYWIEASTSFKENFIVLRNYFELLTKERNHGDNLEKVLIAVENAAYEMARHSFFALMSDYETRRHYYDGDFFGEDILSGFRFSVLKALVLKSDSFSSSAPLICDELVITYVKYVQDNLLDLLKNDAIDLTDTVKGQLMILHEWLTFLMHLLITYPLKHNSEQEKPSNIRLDFQALARNVGSVICSYFDSPEVEEMSLGLSDLIEKADVIKGEIIKTICSMVLREEQESPKKDELGSLIILLQNLNEFKDLKPGLKETWKDHENLIFFIFYLSQNNIRGGNHIGDDEFSRNMLQLDASLINHEELNGVLISAQVVAFNMACYSLLRRYGRFRWWELYLGTEKHVDIHMRVGILKAIVLSRTAPLTLELLIAYGECVQDNLIELLRNEASDPLPDQLNILHEGIPFLVRMLISNRDEQEKLSHIKVGFQDLVWRVGSVICSCFNNRVHGDMLTELSNLVEKMNRIIVEIEELVHLVHINKLRRESPKTNQLCSLNLLLENWKGLMEYESDLIIIWKDQFQMIHENFVLFKSFITSSSAEDDESKNLCSSIMDAGHVAEYLLTTFSAGICPIWCTSLWISELTEHVERIKAVIMEVNEKKCTVNEISTAGKDQSQVSAQAILVPTSTDLVVGFEVEIELIRKRLAGHLKRLEVISIVGMPGLGKTTLARKVYEDPFTKNYFDARAWCCVSQNYNKKEMLLTILGSIIQLTDETRSQKESELSVMVHKQLMSRRYFIVLDDIWNIKAYLDLKCFFPDDSNGSRVMLTSRSKVIGLQAQAQCHSDLIEPGLLTDKQSWDLLARKVYNKGKCPDELCQIGKEIAKKCKGLPLAIVVVGGVLAKGTRKRDFWEQVTRNLSSYLARDSESQFMAALELSYEFLPDYLKPMFIYLAAYPEDKEIPADELMRLWMAEGFLQNAELTNLESEAEKNLMDLIDRSLVMVAKRRWDGKVKACHVHDLLHDMCLAKAKEEKFMQQVHVHSELPHSVMYQRRLSIFLERYDEITSRHLVAYNDLSKFSITPPIYSLLFFHVTPGVYWWEGLAGIASIFSSLKLLKVFEAKTFVITQDVLDKGLIMLIHLKYVSFCGSNIESIPSSISRLRSLETLIIVDEGHQNINVPETIWEMTKLRYLNISRFAKFSVAPETSLILENLVTLSTPNIDLGEEEKIFKKVPGLKKLSCNFEYCKHDCQDQLANFKSLGKLESLRVRCPSGFRGQLKLPVTLKKLSIAWFRLKWSEISIFQTLPNLEVLKLRDYAVHDEYWDMGDDDVFTNLKLLVLDDLNIKIWSACSENFPSLEKLVLKDCRELKEMPSSLEEFYTLQEIEVRGSLSSSSVKMAKEIKNEQEENGNDSLKFYIYEYDY